MRNMGGLGGGMGGMGGMDFGKHDFLFSLLDTKQAQKDLKLFYATSAVLSRYVGSATFWFPESGSAKKNADHRSRSQVNIKILCSEIMLNKARLSFSNL